MNIFVFLALDHGSEIASFQILFDCLGRLFLDHFVWTVRRTILGDPAWGEKGGAGVRQWCGWLGQVAYLAGTEMTEGPHALEKCFLSCCLRVRWIGNGKEGRMPQKRGKQSPHVMQKSFGSCGVQTKASKRNQRQAKASQGKQRQTKASKGKPR